MILITGTRTAVVYDNDVRREFVGADGQIISEYRNVWTLQREEDFETFAQFWNRRPDIDEDALPLVRVINIEHPVRIGDRVEVMRDFRYLTLMDVVRTHGVQCIATPLNATVAVYRFRFSPGGEWQTYLRYEDTEGQRLRRIDTEQLIHLIENLLRV